MTVAALHQGMPDQMTLLKTRSLSNFAWLLNKKAARVEVNILLDFLHWVE